MNRFAELFEIFQNTDFFQNYEKYHKELEELRRNFVSQFPVNEIQNLKINEYVVGKKNETGDESFCYWLETKLMSLGKIKGGTTADKKFGVYYGSTKYDSEKKYRTIHKWNDDLDPFEAFKTIKKEIVRLLEVGEEKKFDAINDNLISPMFKGKILATYFPENYLTIFSEVHLDHFLKELPISYSLSKTKTIIDKQRTLLKFKNKHNIMKEWDNLLFSTFLYRAFNPKGISEEYMLAKNPTLKFIDFIYQQKVKSKKITKGGKKINYVEKAKRNQAIGRMGELLILDNEIKKLENVGREDLAKKVKQVSLDDDSLGYDVLSFDKDGIEMHIEIKSTASSPNKVDFYITENEFRKTLEDVNHYIYLIYNVDKKNPKVHILDKSVLNEQNMMPVNYKVSLDVEII